MNETDERGTTEAGHGRRRGGRTRAELGRPRRDRGVGQRQAAQQRRRDALGRHRDRDGEHAAVPALQPVGRRVQHEVPRASPSRRRGRARAPGSRTPRTARSTSAPPTPTCRPSVVSANPDLKNIPLAISAQMVAYNIPGVLSHLKLTGKVLSEIYQGQITNVEQLADREPEPGRHAARPSRSSTLHRSDSSGDTFLFTQYLSKTDPSGWGAKIGFNTTVPWPNAPGRARRDGQLGHGDGLQGHAGLHRLRRHQLPDPGPAGRPRLRRAAATPRASTWCRQRRRSPPRPPAS